MKKIKIFYYCFGGLFLLVWVYFEIFIKPESLFWLIGELTGLFSIIAGRTIIDILEKKETREKIITGLCFGLLAIGFLSYRQISNYKRNICQGKFGPEFNARRRSLGISEIPANWRISSRGTRTVNWQAKDSVIGHESKYISIDSNCSIKLEDDEYDFKNLNGKSRDVSIRFKYARGKAKDSVFFSYYNGDTTRNISRQQADSLFAAEKIKKDY